MMNSMSIVSHAVIPGYTRNSTETRALNAVALKDAAEVVLG